MCAGLAFIVIVNVWQAVQDERDGEEGAYWNDVTSFVHESPHLLVTIFLFTVIFSPLRALVVAHWIVDDCDHWTELGFCVLFLESLGRWKSALRTEITNAVEAQITRSFRAAL